MGVQQNQRPQLLISPFFCYQNPDTKNNLWLKKCVFMCFVLPFFNNHVINSHKKFVSSLMWLLSFYNYQNINLKLKKVLQSHRSKFLQTIYFRTIDTKKLRSVFKVNRSKYCYRKKYLTFSQFSEFFRPGTEFFQKPVLDLWSAISKAYCCEFSKQKS